MTLSTSEVAAAYDAVAELYTSLFADDLETHPEDRRMIDELVDACPTGSLVIDAGCGPGHVSAHMAERGNARGIEVVGVDASPAMIEIARGRHPTIEFQVGHLEALDLPSGRARFVLSRYSVIHLPPPEITTALRELHRVLAPGGRLLMSFFAADDSAGHGESFDHKAATAHRLSPEVIVDELRAVGFVDVEGSSRPTSTGRRFPLGTVTGARAGHTD